MIYDDVVGKEVGNVKIRIEEIGPDEEEELILRCRKVSPDILRVVQRLKALETGLVGSKDAEIHKVAFDDVFYFEVVDGKSFLYCQNIVLESRLKLYEFEELSQGTSFFRASKSMMLNADKIDFITPSLSGRFEAALLNGEKVIVSRQYVGKLKEKMGV